ncbi:MAG: T9SS type A sorting domain-containing protein [Crocinitomicaceae bacterium]|nr:T9SS type A sorting domain-containing protein [Crocinitomicaceae bacterium]
MRLILFLYFGIFILFSSSSQDWVTINGLDYEPGGFVNGGSGWRPGNKQFKINPYNNTIWMASNTFAHGFDGYGNYFKFDDTNALWFVNSPNFSTILEFEFTSDQTFLIDIYNGILRYDGSTWWQIATGDYSNSIYSDGDSIWVARQSLDYFTWKDGSIQYENFTGFERIVSRNGVIWASPSYDEGLLYRLNNNIPSDFYSPDTSMLLDNTNYDFKFARNSDTLYTAGALGISLAYNDMFIDTITPGNSINMPGSSIREIEFDQNDNIWALFGTDVYQNTHIAYYDQQTETWSQIYDNTNSPISWAGRVSIEVDSAGNLYVAAGIDLHGLKINNWPEWLGVDEFSEANTSVLVHPNPANDIVSVTFGNNASHSVIVTDINGKLIESYEDIHNKLTIDISRWGHSVYFIKSIDENGYISNNKFIKE